MALGQNQFPVKRKCNSKKSSELQVKQQTQFKSIQRMEILSTWLDLTWSFTRRKMHDKLTSYRLARLGPSNACNFQTMENIWRRERVLSDNLK